MSGPAKPLLTIAMVAVAGTAIGWFLFEAVPQAKSPTPNIAAHSQEAADFYRACMAAPEDTSSEHFWAFQRSFCECNTEVAVEQLESQDIRIILSRNSGGKEAAAKVLSKLSDAELAAHVKRLYAMNEKAIPHCMEVGTAAREAAREAM